MTWSRTSPNPPWEAAYVHTRKSNQQPDRAYRLKFGLGILAEDLLATEGIVQEMV